MKSSKKHFWAVSEVFRKFPNYPENFPKISKQFLAISEDFQKFVKIAKDFPKFL